MYAQSTRFNRRLVVAAGTATIASMTLAGCWPFPSSSSSQPQRPLALTLTPGVSELPFYAMIGKGAQAEGRQHDHVAMTITAPTDVDPQEQAHLVEAAIARHVDAILICPYDPQVLLDPLRRAHQAGILVITIDSPIGDRDYTHGAVTFPLTHVASDNQQAGRLAAERLIEAMGGSSTVAIVSGVPTNRALAQRVDAFKAAIALTNGAVSVTTLDHDGGLIDTAMDQATTVLRQQKNLTRIFGTNHFSSWGIDLALVQTGRAKHLRFVYVDASSEGIAALRHDEATVVIAQDLVTMGRRAVQVAVDALREEKPPAKAITTSCTAITKETLDSPEAQALCYTL